MTDRPAPALVIGSGPEDAARRRVRFGTVTVSVRQPSRAEVKRNVDLSTAALRRARDSLVRGQVRLLRKKDVPLFYLDTNHPGRFARRLNGRVEYGVLENGEFKVRD